MCIRDSYFSITIDNTLPTGVLPNSNVFPKNNTSLGPGTFETFLPILENFCWYVAKSTAVTTMAQIVQSIMIPEMVPNLQDLN